MTNEVEAELFICLSAVRISLLVSTELSFSLIHRCTLYILDQLFVVCCCDLSFHFLGDIF